MYLTTGFNQLEIFSTAIGLTGLWPRRELKKVVADGDWGDVGGGGGCLLKTFFFCWLQYIIGNLFHKISPCSTRDQSGLHLI